MKNLDTRLRRIEQAKAGFAVIHIRHEEGDPNPDVRVEKAVAEQFPDGLPVGTELCVFRTIYEAPPVGRLDSR